MHQGGFDSTLRQFGLASAYLCEAEFYRHLAPGLDIRLPRCWSAAADEAQGQGIVILDDLTTQGVTFGDCTTPWSTDQVAAGLEQLAILHADTWQADSSRYQWLTHSPLRDVGQTLLTADYWQSHFSNPDAPPVPENLLDRTRTVAAIDALWRISDLQPHSVSHGDPHLGNTYLTANGAPAFIDWQGLCSAPPMDDVAYFVAGSLTVADRRSAESELLAHYLGALKAAGGPDFDTDAAWLDYRRQQLHGFFWALTNSHMQPWERVAAMTERHTAAIEDHDSIAAILG